jgi:hypothetical protein
VIALGEWSRSVSTIASLDLPPETAGFTGKTGAEFRAGSTEGLVVAVNELPDHVVAIHHCIVREKFTFGA